MSTRLLAKIGWEQWMLDIGGLSSRYLIQNSMLWNVECKIRPAVAANVFPGRMGTPTSGRVNPLSEVVNQTHHQTLLSEGLVDTFYLFQQPGTYPFIGFLHDRLDRIQHILIAGPQFLDDRFAGLVLLVDVEIEHITG